MIKKVFISLLILFTIIPTVQTFAAERTEEKMISYSKKFIGVPYRFGGTSTSGFDCSGYTMHIYENFEKSLPRTSGSQYSVGNSVGKSELEVGDLVFFATSKSSKISHVGIYIGNQKFIHSQSNIGVSISNIDDPYYWGDRYVGAKRVADFK